MRSLLIHLAHAALLAAPVGLGLADGLAQSPSDGSPSPGSSSSRSSADDPKVFEVESLPEPTRRIPPGRLETPQACVEWFVEAATDGDWRRAAGALNLRLVEADPARAAELAEHLHFVLDQELWIDWSVLPDRADGLVEPGALGTAGPMAGQPRRSIRIGTIPAPRHDVSVLVERVQAPDHPPVWLFAAHTVENIPALWDQHGPSPLARALPSWARERGPWRLPVWQWFVLIATLLLAPTLGFVAGRGASRLISRRTEGRVEDVSRQLRWPVCAVIAASLTWLVVDVLLGMPSAVALVLEPLTLIAMVASIVWLIVRGLGFVIDQFVKDSILDLTADGESQRRLLTQMTVARHVILLLVVLIGVAVVLLQLNSFRAVGLTLLSSAGAMAVILGIAGHAVLGNLVAGLYIAFGQPFRIGDSVVVQGQWGNVEDITYVNVVVCTWDERRLVFPVRWFVTNWFENWSKNDEFLICPIYLQVDYRADVDAIRERFLEFVHADDAWAGEERDQPQTLVTTSDDETLTVRLTAGGSNVSDAWNLSCRVREKLYAWLREVDDGAWLPRRRIHVAPRAALPTGEGSGHDAGDGPIVARPEAGESGEGP